MRMLSCLSSSQREPNVGRQRLGMFFRAALSVISAPGGVEEPAHSRRNGVVHGHGERAGLCIQTADNLFFWEMSLRATLVFRGIFRAQGEKRLRKKRTLSLADPFAWAAIEAKTYCPFQGGAANTSSVVGPRVRSAFQKLPNWFACRFEGDRLPVSVDVLRRLVVLLVQRGVGRDDGPRSLPSAACNRVAEKTLPGAC